MQDPRSIVAVVTGASSGIGAAVAERLAAQGANLVLVCRDRARGGAGVERLRAAHPGVSPELVLADLSLVRSTRAAAAAIRENHPRIDLLVNNAGAMFMRRETTEEGLERTFALNHLGYFVLTAGLLDALAAAPAARIVNVASEAHRGPPIPLDDLNFERGYRGWTAYQRSKLANILFTRSLARRLAGGSTVANCLHPGFVASRFGANNAGTFRLVMGIAKLAAVRPATAADRVMHLATEPEAAATSGGYFVDRRPREPSAAAHDDAAGERLWEASERLAGGV